MIVTQIHRERALEVIKNGETEQSIKDTLKVIYCMVEQDKKQEVEKLYNSLFKARKKDDSFHKKIFRMFFR